MTKSSSSDEKKKNAHFLKFKGHSIILSIKCDKGKKTIAINPKTKQPYVVWFVNNTSPAPGLGTFESPFPTLVQAQNASAPNDIIYVYTGDGTDKGMNAGIALQQGQLLFGASIDQTIKTTVGHVTIPARSTGLPTISNTNSTFVSTSFNVVLLQFDDNTVSGLNLVDNIGGAHLDSFLDQSGGVRVNKGFNYLITNNTISTFNNATLEQPGGIGVDIFGGGNVTVTKNTVIGRDATNAITFGVWMRSAVAPFQKSFVFNKNLFTGADANSGLNAGFVIAIIPFSPTFGNVGDVNISITDNICNSQTNTGNDHGTGIFINSFPVVDTSIHVDIKGNYITIPAGIEFPTAGIQLIGNGPGPTIASLHRNVSLTIPPTPGYIFSNSGNPANLILDMGYDNFGTSSGP